MDSLPRNYKVIIQGLSLRQNTWLVNAENRYEVFKRFAPLITREGFDQYSASSRNSGRVFKYIYMEKRLLKKRTLSSLRYKVELIVVDLSPKKK